MTTRFTTKKTTKKTILNINTEQDRDADDNISIEEESLEDTYVTIHKLNTVQDINTPQLNIN